MAPPSQAISRFFYFFSFSEGPLPRLFQIVQRGFRPCPKFPPPPPAGFPHFLKFVPSRFLLGAQLLHLLLKPLPGLRPQPVGPSSEMFDLVAPPLQLLLHFPENLFPGPLPRFFVIDHPHHSHL